MTNYNDGNWHGWDGGKCPVHPETVVDVALNNAPPIEGEKAKQRYWGGGGTCNIIAFRVTKEYREPREWWINIYDYDSHDTNKHAFASQEQADHCAYKNRIACIKVREVLDDV